MIDIVTNNNVNFISKKIEEHPFFFSIYLKTRPYIPKLWSDNLINNNNRSHTASTT